MFLTIDYRKWLTPERFFIVGIMGVNGLNYLFNLVMGWMLGPEGFADVALMITLLLIFSFLATSFQVVTTKFYINLENQEKKAFLSFITRNGLGLGIFLMILIALFAPYFQKILNTQYFWIFVIFALGIPIYFVVSINRGIFQAEQNFIPLTYTYLSEAVVKLLLSVGLIYLGWLHSSIAVSFAILGSLMVALIPFNTKAIHFKKVKTTYLLKKKILYFFGGVLLYELIQVLINSSDIFLTKMFFSNREAGLYASLALIGRVVYFLTWMLVMLVLPKIIQASKDGENAFKVMRPFLLGITFFCMVIIAACLFFSNTIVTLMFGPQFAEIHSLLYLYAIATSLFAFSNIIIYYFLSLDDFKLVYAALFFGILQIVLIFFFHDTLAEVVKMQIASMSMLTFLSLVYLWLENNKKHIKVVNLIK